MRWPGRVSARTACRIWRGPITATRRRGGSREAIALETLIGVAGGDRDIPGGQADGQNTARVRRSGRCRGQAEREKHQADRAEPVTV